MDGWMDGGKNKFKDCRPKSKIDKFDYPKCIHIKIFYIEC